MILQLCSCKVSTISMFSNQIGYLLLDYTSRKKVTSHSTMLPYLLVKILTHKHTNTKSNKNMRGKREKNITINTLINKLNYAGTPEKKLNPDRARYSCRRSKCSCAIRNGSPRALSPAPTCLPCPKFAARSDLPYKYPVVAN